MEQELLDIIGSPGTKIKQLEKNGEGWFNMFTRLGLLKKGMKVLDYGAGIGRTAIPFSKIAKVTAYEPNLEMAEYLRDRSWLIWGERESSSIISHIYVHNNPAKINGTFDFIICTYVFQHIPIEETRQILEYMATMSNTLYFTFPTTDQFPNGYPNENYGPESEKDLTKVNKWGTPDFGSIVLTMDELKGLFARSWDIKTLRKPYPLIYNLYEIKI